MGATTQQPITTTWYKVEAEYLRDTKAFQTFTQAFFHFLNLNTSAKVIEMQGAQSTGTIIAEK